MANSPPIYQSVNFRKRYITNKNIYRKNNPGIEPRLDGTNNIMWDIVAHCEGRTHGFRISRHTSFESEDYIRTARYHCVKRAVGKNAV